MILCRRQRSVNNNHQHQHHQVELFVYSLKISQFSFDENINKTQAIQGDHGEEREWQASKLTQRRENNSEEESKRERESLL